MEHSHAAIGQSSKEGGAQVFEAEDWASCWGQQDQQGLNGRVHAAVHVDAVRTGTWLRTKERWSALTSPSASPDNKAHVGAATGLLL